jgi:hypothetical protein
MYMSSPVLVNGRVVGLSHWKRGQYFGLDPATGRVEWKSEPGQGRTRRSWWRTARSSSFRETARCSSPRRAAHRSPPPAAITWARAPRTRTRFRRSSGSSSRTRAVSRSTALRWRAAARAAPRVRGPAGTERRRRGGHRPVGAPPDAPPGRSAPTARSHRRVGLPHRASHRGRPLPIVEPPPRASVRRQLGHRGAAGRRPPASLGRARCSPRGRLVPRSGPGFASRHRSRGDRSRRGRGTPAGRRRRPARYLVIGDEVSRPASARPDAARHPRVLPCRARRPRRGNRLRAARSRQALALR